jgi:ATP-dependent DNA ligase
MKLSIRPPLAPMEALSTDVIPIGEGWQYEPKWDGFRCIIFRDGDQIEIQSKAEKSLSRYFPEVMSATRSLRPKAFALDGELVVPSDGGFSFDALLQRIHPAATRVARLSEETPALVIVFDLLAKTARRFSSVLYETVGRSLKLSHDASFSRAALFASLRVGDAQRWLEQVGATLDGIIACAWTYPTSPVNAPPCRRSRTTGPPIALSADFASIRGAASSARCS